MADRRLSLLVLPLLALGFVAPASAQTTASVDAGPATSFTPATVEVAVGGTVTWTNKGGFHTVTGGTGPSADPASPIPRQVLTNTGDTATFTFTTAGTFDYFCEPHASVGMVGKVIVGGGGAAAPSPSASVAPSETASAAPAGGESPSASASPSAEGEHSSEYAVPNLEDNPVYLGVIHEREEENKKKSGFLALLGGSFAAVLALGAALTASTRPRG